MLSQAPVIVPILAILIYVGLCCGVGWIAQAKMYRSFLGWFVLSFIFCPLTALLFLVIAGIPLDAAQVVENNRPAAEEFFVDCQCGGRLVVTKGEAGTRRQCARCGQFVSIPSYSTLAWGVQRK